MLARNPAPTKTDAATTPAPPSPLDGTLWANPDLRRPIYSAITSAASPQVQWSGKPAESPTTRILRKNHAVKVADERFYNAMRQAVLAERRACAAVAAKRAPKTAALILARADVPEWSEK